MYKFIKTEARKLKSAILHPTFIFLSLTGTGVLFACVTLVYFFEKNLNPKMKTFFDSLWWGVSTITTVGYGDITPVTPAGRVIGLALMYSGTVLFIAFTGILVTLWMKKEVEDEIRPLERGMRDEEKGNIRMEKMLGQILERLDRIEKK